MNDRELGILQVTIWAFLIYCLVLAVVAVWRRFIRNGDVVKDAEDLAAEAELVIAATLADYASIDSFVSDWMRPPPRTAIAEAIYVDRQRDHR